MTPRLPLRFWLIRLLAGKSMILLNARVRGNVSGDFGTRATISPRFDDDDGGTGFVSNNHFSIPEDAV